MATDLKIADFDINDSSQFYRFSFMSEDEGFQQNRIILEQILDLMRVRSVEDLKKKVEGRNSHKRKLRRRNSFKNLNGKEPESQPILKTLLIDGKSVEIILKNPVLAQHFLFILRYCKNLLGYSLSASHKGFITACIKQASRKVVLAVGDGFNDMAMLKEADIGVQLQHPEVPLVFGDIALTELGPLSDLIFKSGKSLSVNLRIACIYLIGAQAIPAWILLFFNYRTHFKGNYFSNWETILIFMHSKMACLIGSIFNQGMASKYVDQNPQILKKQNFLTMVMCSFVWTFF